VQDKYNVMEKKMKKISVLVLTLFLIAIVSPAFSTEALKKNLIPEEAKWVVHIDVEKFAQTHLKKVLLEKSHFPLEREIFGIEKTANINFFEDIVAVTFIGMINGDEPVIAFSGNLNKDHLLGLLKKEEHEEIQHGQFLIYNWGNNEYGAFISDRLLVISENRHDLEKVLDTFAGKAKSISGTLDSKLKSVSPHAFIFAAADNISEMVKDEDDFPSQILQKTESLFFAASEQGNTLKLVLNLQTDSPTTAKNLVDMAQGLKAFLAMSDKVDPEWDLLKNMNISIKGNAVLVESESSPEGLLKVLLGMKF